MTVGPNEECSNNAIKNQLKKDRTIMKNFKELTKGGQTRRLAKYASERQELGEKYGKTIENSLFTIVRPATIKENAKNDGSKSAIFRLVHTTADKKSEFVTASAYIPAGKASLEAYYASVAKGQLVTVDFVRSNGHFIQVWKMMNRERKEK